MPRVFTGVSAERRASISFAALLVNVTARIDKGLAWQETFDFGKGGPQAFQLPAVGLLAPPPASELKRTREEL